MPEIHFSLPIAAVGKGRPRARVVQGKGRKEFASVYTPSETKSYEATIREAAADAMSVRSIAPTAQPCSLSVVIGQPWPRSRWRKRDQRAGGDPVTGKPDLDNVAKAIADAMNGVVYLDDSQVYWLTVRRERVAQGMPHKLDVTVTWRV